MNSNYSKEFIRGTIKEIMKTRGLRTISVANYEKWKNDGKKQNDWLHSIKINMEDGYLHMHGYSNTNKAGTYYEKPTMEQYSSAFDYVNEILDNEDKIPSKIKRNILVKICR